MYIQNAKLIQYKPTMNPLDPLGLHGMQYTVANPSKYVNKNINSQNVNQAYLKQAQAQAQINQNKPQNIYTNNNLNPKQYHQTLKPQTKIQPNQNTQPHLQYYQQPQMQVKTLANQKPNNLQQQQIKQNQNAQLQAQGPKPNELGYQKYVQRYPAQNQNEKVNIEYNKKDQHFVNKPIYDLRKVPANPLQVQVPQNAQKQIKTIPQKAVLDKGTKIGNNYNNQKISQNQVGVPNDIKSNNKKLSTIKEEEINIKQSGLSDKISQISNKTNSIKEFPMEEKTPEVALPNDLMENNSQHNITQKTITESAISDFDANLSHLPTIGSIMKGKSEPLPPSKGKKY